MIATHPHSHTHTHTPSLAKVDAAGTILIVKSKREETRTGS